MANNKEFTGYGYNKRMKVAYAPGEGGSCVAVRTSRIPVDVIINAPDTVPCSMNDLFKFSREIGLVSKEEEDRIDNEVLAELGK